MTTSRKLPAVAFTDLATHLAAAPRGTAVLGVDEHDNPVAYDSHRAPHLAITTPTGAGRSAALRLVLAQALAHGTRVILGDRKSAQRWCHDHPNVTLAREAAQVHRALCEAGAELGRRRRDGAAGDPIVVALDDQCTLMGRLMMHWKDTGNGADPISPAVTAFAEILYSGRAYNITVASAGVLFSHQTLGGPTLRDSLMDQYGTRLAGPGTSHVGLELLGADPAPAPRLHDRGTFDRFTEGIRTRFQSAWITETEARAWANN